MKWNICGYSVTPCTWHYLCLLHAATFFVTTGLGAHYEKFQNPHFSEISTNVTQYIGQTAVLQCIITHLGARKVQWRKLPDTNPITIGTFTYVPDQSYEVRKNGKQDHWDLIIHNVQPKHAGMYECRISSKDELAVQINLTVIDKPPVKRRHEIHMSGTQYVDVGQAIILTCNATGVDYIPQDVDWFKNGNEIKANPQTKIYITKYQSVSARSLHSELQIKHGRMSDAGTYICRSSDMDIASIKVHVLNDKTNNRKRGTFGQEVKRSKEKQAYSKNGANPIHTHPSSLGISLLFALTSHILERNMREKN